MKKAEQQYLNKVYIKGCNDLWYEERKTATKRSYARKLITTKLQESKGQREDQEYQNRNFQGYHGQTEEH